MTIRKLIIKKKRYLFALGIIKFVNDLLKITVSFELGNQLIKSNTSIRANIEEAIGESSKKDFLHKLNIPKKEVSPTPYWLRLILTQNYSIMQE